MVLPPKLDLDHIFIFCIYSLHSDSVLLPTSQRQLLS